MQMRMKSLRSGNGKSSFHRNLEVPFVENSGKYMKPLWISKAQQYGVESKRSKLGFKSDYVMGIFNVIGSIIIALEFIMKPDTLLGIALTILYTLLYWYYGQHLTVDMSWNVVSLGIIFPITQNIGMAFKRREQALRTLGFLTGNLRALWGALHTWNIKDKDKGWIRVIEKMGESEEETREELRLLFDEFLTSMITYFDTVRWRRARHVLSFLHEEQTELENIAHDQRMCIDSALARIQRVVQELKVHGLSGGEAHRLDQYASKMSLALDQLAALKEYRTPQAFRAFARIYIQILGALYGPYFVDLAKGSNGDQANLGFAIAFAIAIQLTMSGLYHVMLGLEDPFARLGGRGQLDSVRVPELLEMSRKMLIQVQEESSQDWRGKAQKNGIERMQSRSPLVANSVS